MAKQINCLICSCCNGLCKQWHVAGFGSLVVDDPKGLSETILEAAARVKDAGQRILLSRCKTLEHCSDIFHGDTCRLISDLILQHS